MVSTQVHQTAQIPVDQPQCEQDRADIRGSGALMGLGLGLGLGAPTGLGLGLGAPTGLGLGLGAPMGLGSRHPIRVHTHPFGVETGFILLLTCPYHPTVPPFPHPPIPIPQPP